MNKKSKRLHLFLTHLSLIGIIFSFNNCGSGFETKRIIDATSLGSENPPGDDANPPDDINPPVSNADLTIAFPPAGAVSVNHIIVRGSTRVGLNITQVRVQNVNASTTNNFATWRVDVPLMTGVNNLRVDMTVNGTEQIGVMTIPIERFSSDAAISRGSGPWAARLMNIGFEPVNNRLVISDADDDGLWEMRMDNGNRRKLSDIGTIGTGPDYSQPTFLTAYADSCIVVDSNRLLSVDLTNGNRTLLSAANPNSISHVTRSVSGNTIYVVEQDTRSVLRINPTTGASTVVSSNTVGSGPTFNNVGGMVVSWSRNIGYVMGYSDRIYAVDLATGDRQIFSEAISGEPTLGNPYQMAIDDVNQYIYIYDSAQLVQINMQTGRRRVINSSGTLSSLNDIKSITVTPYGPALADVRHAYEGSPRTPTIIVIDPLEGTRIVVGR